MCCNPNHVATIFFCYFVFTFAHFFLFLLQQLNKQADKCICNKKSTAKEITTKTKRGKCAELARTSGSWQQRWVKALHFICLYVCMSIFGCAFIYLYAGLAQSKQTQPTCHKLLEPRQQRQAQAHLHSLQGEREQMAAFVGIPFLHMRTALFSHTIQFDSPVRFNLNAASNRNPQMRSF